MEQRNNDLQQNIADDTEQTADVEQSEEVSKRSEYIAAEQPFNEAFDEGEPLFDEFATERANSELDEQLDLDGQFAQQATDEYVDDASISEQPAEQSAESPATIDAGVEAPAPADDIKSARWKNADKVFNIVLWVAIALLLALVLLRAFVTTSIAVDGHSMDDTFSDGEVLWINKLAKPQRGQVTVFFKNDVDSKFLSLFGTKEDNSREGKYAKLIKRVVAVEGDKIWVEEVSDGLYEVHVLTPQGDELKEDYYTKYGEAVTMRHIYEHAVTGLGLLSEHVGRENAMEIHAGYFFAMGDHRENSADSRTIGEVPYDRVVGVMID